MKQKKGALILLAWCAALVILLFLLMSPWPKAVVDWVALGFLLLGILGVTMMLAKEGGTLFANLALGCVSGIYLCANLGLALLANVFFQEQILQYIAWQLVLLVIASGICILLVHFKNVQERNRKMD